MRYSGQIITLKDLGVRVKQVNKTTARKLYNKGKEIYLNSCNMCLNNPWTSPMLASKELCGKDFDLMLIYFQNYNCDSERGRYANFFVEVE